MTRAPRSINDTAGYPTAIVTTIFDDLQTENPRPGFAVGTGDYQFSSTGGTQTGPQLDLYAQARTHFSNPVYPAMGNHECTGATKSNCGAGTANGTTKIYSAYLAKVLTPAGIHNPYYSLLVKPPNNAWSAKVVFVAANAWTSTQSAWLDSVLAQPTTYTFIVRHESSKATTAPGVTPSATIIATHPYTMLIVGHDHTYKRLSQKEVIVGNGGAPLTTGSAYGYGIVSRRSDGAIQLTFYNYKTHAIMDSFAVKADGSKATSTPPPSGTFALTPNPASVSSSGASATSAISLTSSSGYCRHGDALGRRRTLRCAGELRVVAARSQSVDHAHAVAGRRDAGVVHDQDQRCQRHRDRDHGRRVDRCGHEHVRSRRLRDRWQARE